MYLKRQSSQLLGVWDLDQKNPSELLTKSKMDTWLMAAHLISGYNNGCQVSGTGGLQ